MKRFFILGLLSTGIDFGLYTLSLFFNLGYVLAIIIGYGSGFIFNFYAGKKYVFKNGVKIENRFRELFFTLLIAIIGLFINVLVVFLLTLENINMDLLFSRCVAITIAFFWNYYARKLFVYY